MVSGVVMASPAQASPSGGSGGPWTDQLKQSFTYGGLTSTYNLFASGLDQTKEVGIIWWGDGSGDYGNVNPTQNYLHGGTNGLAAVGKRNNMIDLSAIPPGGGCTDGDGSCWYEPSGSVTVAQKTAWLDALLTHVYSRYPIEKDRVLWAGYSSGAQNAMRFQGPQLASKYMTDGAVLGVSYGGDPAVATNFPAAFKSNVVYEWNTGSLDSAYTTTARYGVKAGEAWYRNAGFATKLTVVSGVGHARDGQFGAIADGVIQRNIRPAAPLSTTPPPPPGETTQTGYVTGYSWYDNDPPGSAAIAYTDVRGRTEAGGTGTFADPLTVAAPVGGLPKGTKVYIPHLERYGIVEDECATSHSAPDGCTADVDVWVDGRDLPEATVDQCMSDLTGDHPFVVNPASGKPVRSGPVCGSGTTPPPPAPAATVTATATAGDGTVKVNWSTTNVTDPATAGIWVQKVDGTSGAWYRELTGSHTFTGLTNGTAQTFEVFITRDGVTGTLASTTVTATPKAATPAAWSTTVSPTRTGGSFTTQVPSGYSGSVYVKLGDGSYVYETGQVGPKSLTQTFTTRKCGTTYTYRVEAPSGTLRASGSFTTLPC